MGGHALASPEGGGPCPLGTHYSLSFSALGLPITKYSVKTLRCLHRSGPIGYGPIGYGNAVKDNNTNRFICITVNQWGSWNGPGREGAIRGSSRSAQLDGKWSKTWNDYGWVLIKGGIWQMTSCHIITGHAASAGNLMTRFYITAPATVVMERRLLVPKAVNRIVYGL